MAKELNKDQQRLVSENMELAEHLAWRFGKSILADRHEKCITMDDLKGEAMLGLCEAAMRYDSALGVEFRTYAFIWCRKFVLRAVRKFGAPLSVPCNFKGGVGVMHIDARMDTVASANADRDDNGTAFDRIFYQLIKADELEKSAKEALQVRIENALSGLTAKECRVIELLFNDDETPSIESMALELDVVSGRVSQIKDRALRKLERILSNK